MKTKYKEIQDGTPSTLPHTPLSVTFLFPLLLSVPITEHYVRRHKDRDRSQVYDTIRQVSQKDVLWDGSCTPKDFTSKDCVHRVKERLGKLRGRSGTGRL